MNIILIFIIAVSLSMDAFSLSLAYGTISMQKKDVNLLSIIVGVYHFFMPILGMVIGKIMYDVVHLSGNFIILIIFSFIGIIIYFGITFKTKIIYDVFGKGNVDKILNKFRKR